MTSAGRLGRADAADALCSAAFARAADAEAAVDVALVAVGGYGRRELAPHSDLDVVLVHADHRDVEKLAARLWYPLWDAGAAVDHSVRSLSQATSAAEKDLRVALGLLDTRHVAGDPAVTLKLRSALLTQWRRTARRRLPELRDMVRSRGALMGDLGHVSVPDLKESAGGLRDANVLKALVAAWLVDVPHTQLERARTELLDVRDALHDVSGRASDRVPPELWGELADRLGLGDAEDVQRHTRELGRRIAYLSRLTWRRVDHLLTPRAPGNRARRPSLKRVAPGVAVSEGEVVLDGGTDPTRDPLLLLRAAVEAAERDLVLAPATAGRLSVDAPRISEPWPAEARHLFIRLLAAGAGLLGVWETLDQEGALNRLLPEWQRVRLLPHASQVHRYTVDRHLVETCVEASRMIRRVARPDVLLLAALLHDIGKGMERPHAAVGGPIAEDVARRLGFDEPDVLMVGRLVREHLLLVEIATTRDVEDPETAAKVAQRVGDEETLQLLAVLTEADARATSAKAWTAWRAGLVGRLVERVGEAWSPALPARRSDTSTPELVVPAVIRQNPTEFHLAVEDTPGGSRVTVIAMDRVGLLAATAATFVVRRIAVRAARAWNQAEFAVSVWDLEEPHLDPALLRQCMRAVLEGRVDPTVRLNGAAPASDSSVAVRHDASREATVLEVRTADRPGVVYLACASLAAIQVSVRSAHVATVGPQAVNTFYLQEVGAGPLRDERAAEAAHAVRGALERTVTLDA